MGCQTRSESAFHFSIFFFSMSGKVFPIPPLLSSVFVRRVFWAYVWSVSGVVFSRLPKFNPFQSCTFMSIHASLSFCSISFMLFNNFKWLLQCFILLFGCFGKKRKAKQLIKCLGVALSRALIGGTETEINN